MKKNKIVALALAGTLTVTAMLAGTYAWTAISQRAMNETVGDVNPGGRLHDDFDGTNKDIYVENFTDGDPNTPEEGAVIYARVKLDEYLQIGERIVNPDTAEGEKASYIKPSTWTTFKLKEKDSSIFRQYFNWIWGEGTEYMPTFNKNKDSLEADINGTLAGVNGTAYDDYVKYAVTPQEGEIGSKLGIEIYDVDSDGENEDEVSEIANLYLNKALIAAMDSGSGVIGENFAGDYDDIPIAVDGSIELEFSYKADENGDGEVEDCTGTATVTVKEVKKDESDTITEVYLDLDDTTAAEPDGADIKVVANVEHNAQPTLETKGVINMTQWIAMGCPVDAYWVYDTDGWAYWAQGIDPGTATGCLLTGIERKGSIVDKYHYAINVTAEFATAGDWGTGIANQKNESGKGFYINGITDNGLMLLNTIAGGEKTLIINLATDSGYTEEAGVLPGTTLNLAADVTLGEQVISGDEVVWTLENATDSTLEKTGASTALLTVGENEQAQYVTVKAALEDAPDKVFNSREIAVGSVYTVAVDETAYLAAENVQTATLKAIVTDQRGKEYYDEEVTWALADESNKEITLDKTTGVLTISDEVDATSIEVTATAKVDDVTVEDTGSIKVSSQMDYIATVVDMEKDITDEERKVTVDGVKWYVVSIEEANTNVAGNEALLWAVSPVDGWQTGELVTVTGDDGTTSEWVGWAYYGGQNPFQYELAEGETAIAQGGENWWRYSNVRAWLNSAETKIGYKYKDGSGNLIYSEETQNYAGFLADKDIIRTNAVETVLYTKMEYTGTSDASYYDGLGNDKEPVKDKVFVFTQADVFGTASGNDADGAYQENGTAGEFDYTVNPALQEELYKVSRTNGRWHWLRSPRRYANSVSFIGDGSIGCADYYNTRGCVRPALWLNLPGTSN